MDATASSRSVMRLMGSALPVTVTLSASVRIVFTPDKALTDAFPVAENDVGAATL